MCARWLCSEIFTGRTWKLFNFAVERESCLSVVCSFPNKVITLLEQVVIMGSFIIEGGYALSVSIRPQGARNEVLEVIRTGVSLMIAAMSADGVGVIGGVEQTGRGYEDIDGRLNALEVRTERQY